MAAKVISRNTTVCFTGHRPEKLPCEGNPDAPITKILKSVLYKEVLGCINNGCNRFITGMARGVDLWAGEIILELKARGYDIDLVAAMPYKGHGAGLHNEEKWIFGNIMLKADEVVFVNEAYSNLCMRKRNEYMIDNSGKLIAVVCCYKSGTGQTISLAKKAGLDVHVINAALLYEQLACGQTSLF